MLTFQLTNQFIICSIVIFLIFLFFFIWALFSIININRNLKRFVDLEYKKYKEDCVKNSISS